MRKRRFIKRRKLKNLAIQTKLSASTRLQRDYAGVNLAISPSKRAQNDLETQNDMRVTEGETRERSTKHATFLPQTEQIIRFKRTESATDAGSISDLPETSWKEVLHENMAARRAAATRVRW